MWVVGLLGIRLAVLAPLVQRLPAALVSLPGAPEQGINTNQLAGVLVLYLPFVMILGCSPSAREGAGWRLSSCSLRLGPLARW
jgi:hypothetical protein